MSLNAKSEYVSNTLLQPSYLLKQKSYLTQAIKALILV